MPDAPVPVPADGPTARGVSGPRSAGPTEGLVGRDRERAQLDRIVWLATTGGHQLVTICGPRGSGRKALLGLLKSTAEAGGMRVITYTAVRALHGMPFSGLAAIVEMIRETEEDSADLRAGWWVMTGESRDAPPSREARKSLLRLVAAAVADRPLLVAIERAEWLDEASLDLLIGLGRENVPGFILAMTRQPAADLASLPGEVLTTAPLTDAQAAAAVERRYGPWSREPLDTVVASAGGRPGDLHDLAAALSPEQRRGLSLTPWPTAIPWQLVGRHGATVSALPASMRALLVIATLLPGGEISEITSAIAELGGEEDWLTAAEETGLVRVEGARLRPEPPALGLVAHATAQPRERLAFHAAVAAAHERRGVTHMAAFHLALASRSSDEALAARLEDEADSVTSPAWRARLLDHAAALSAEAGQAGRRRLAAARAAASGGYSVDAWRWMVQLKAQGDPTIAGEAAELLADDSVTLRITKLALVPDETDDEPAVPDDRAGPVEDPVPESRSLEPAEPEWSIQLLGDFAIHRHGRPLAPPMGMPGRLLKLVALRGRVPVDEAVEWLWPQTESDVGRVRLRNVLSRLRASCGDVILRDTELLYLASDADVDAARFEREAALALTAAARGDTDAARLASGAVSRYAGDLLPAELYADWAIATRERLRRRLISLLDTIGLEAAQRGDVEEAVRRLFRAIELEPYEEQRYVTAARILLSHGHRGRSLRLVRQARKVTAELGLAPSPALMELDGELRLRER